MARPKGRKTDPHRTPLRFKQSEIERAIRGVQSMGLAIGRIEIDPVTGKISVTTDKSPGDVQPASAA